MITMTGKYICSLHGTTECPICTDIDLERFPYLAPFTEETQKHISNLTRVVEVKQRTADEKLEYLIGEFAMLKISLENVVEEIKTLRQKVRKLERKQ